MENKNLNEKESLELIARMIRNTHENLETRGGKSMLVNGYTTCLLYTSASLGKGIIASSLAKLLQARGYKVANQKLDPYINIDPGTLNPVSYTHLRLIKCIKINVSLCP